MLEEKMTNCPRCQKPILNGGIFTAPAKFNIRCPWCQATLQINVQPKIITEVVKLANGDTDKFGEKKDNPNNTGLTQIYPEADDANKSKPMRLTGYLYMDKEEA